MKKPPLPFRLFRLPPLHTPTFHTTPSALARNRIYDPIRSLPTLTTTLSLSSTSARPLLALFTLSTSSDSSSQSIRALLLQLLEREGVGEREGGVGFAEVEMDAPDCAAEGVGGIFAITAIPTLMAFSRGEPQQLTKLTDPAELQDREFLTLWIENEARRGGAGGAGGGFFGGIFGLGNA